MNIRSDRIDEVGSLCQQVSRDFGAAAPWNMRSVNAPSAADALAITTAPTDPRAHGGGRLGERIEAFAVPIGKFQSGVLLLLATQRSLDGCFADGIAIDRHRKIVGGRPCAMGKSFRRLASYPSGGHR
jgi:hypothetical protein